MRAEILRDIIELLYDLVARGLRGFLALGLWGVICFWPGQSVWAGDVNDLLAKTESEQSKGVGQEDEVDKFMGLFKDIEPVPVPPVPEVERKPIKVVNEMRHGKDPRRICRDSNDCPVDAICIVDVYSDGKQAPYGMCVCFNELGCAGWQK